MNELKSTRKDDWSDHLPATLRYDPGRWLGAWYNTLAETRHIGHLEILTQNGKLFMRAFGVCQPEPCDWGLAEMSLFNVGVDSYHTEGYLAKYDFGYCETQLCGHEKQNVLVISSFTTFKDGSNRHNYYLREFYYKK